MFSHHIPRSIDDKKSYRVSHKRPSVAVFFFSAISPLTKFWRVELAAGFWRKRSRIF
jgi:hypothetical protein